MTDPKTTITGFITAVFALAASFGFNADVKIVTLILALGAAVGGYLQKDS